MKVIGYVRVSTEEQSTSGVSLAAQEAKLRQYAELYELELVAVVVDAGQSAKTLQRPGLQQVLAALDAGQAEGLLVAKLDRLTRSVRDLGTLLDGYFKARFALLSVADQVDTRTAAGRLVLNLLTSVAEWERECIGERTSAALQHLRSQGVKLGRPVQTTFSGTEQAAISRAQQLREENAPLRRIAEVLTAEGHQTAKGGKWAAQTVALLLKKVGRG